MKQFYFKPCLLFFTILFFSISISAQKSDDLWVRITKEDVSKTQEAIRNSEPSKAMFYQLNFNGLKSILQSAPDRNSFKGASNITVSFPTENGNFETFRIKEASNMTLELQAKFPEIRSYIGQGIDNPSAIIRFSVSPEKGLSSMVLSNKKTVFIEPYTNDLSTYIVFINSSTDKNNSSIKNKFNANNKKKYNEKSFINNDSKSSNNSFNKNNLISFLAILLLVSLSSFAFAIPDSLTIQGKLTNNTG
ncbi:MAG: hypothetical protein IIC74_01445, partial [Bacteroidetes bacterium]|nr:hypothetical protein [Bacteroidota bacterium]